MVYVGYSSRNLVSLMPRQGLFFICILHMHTQAPDTGVRGVYAWIHGKVLHTRHARIARMLMLSKIKSHRPPRIRKSRIHVRDAAPTICRIDLRSARGGNPLVRSRTMACSGVVGLISEFSLSFPGESGGVHLNPPKLGARWSRFCWFVDVPCESRLFWGWGASYDHMIQQTAAENENEPEKRGGGSYELLWRSGRWQRGGRFKSSEEKGG